MDVSFSHPDLMMDVFFSHPQQAFNLYGLPHHLTDRIIAEVLDQRQVDRSPLAPLARLGGRFQLAVEERTFGFHEHRPLRLRPHDLNDFAGVYNQWGNSFGFPKLVRHHLLKSLRLEVLIDDGFFSRMRIDGQTNPALFQQSVVGYAQGVFTRLFDVLGGIAVHSGVALEYDMRISAPIPRDVARLWAEDGLRIDVSAAAFVAAVESFGPARANSLKLAPVSSFSVASRLPHVRHLAFDLPGMRLENPGAVLQDQMLIRALPATAPGLCHLELHLAQGETARFGSALKNFRSLCGCLAVLAPQLESLGLHGVADPNQFFDVARHQVGALGLPLVWPHLTTLVIEGYHENEAEAAPIGEHCDDGSLLRVVFPQLEWMRVTSRRFPNTVDWMSAPTFAFELQNPHHQATMSQSTLITVNDAVPGDGLEGEGSLA